MDVKEREVLQELSNQVGDTQVSYVDYMNERLSYEQALEEQNAALQAMNQIYCQTLMMQALGAARKGAKGAGMLRTLGLFVGCCLFSRSFRSEVNQPVRKSMYPLLQKYEEQASADSFIKKQKLRTEQAEKQGTVPMTPDSFAVASVVFTKQVYEDMRDVHKNTDEVLSNYQTAKEHLYQTAEQSGISRSLVDRTSRKLAGYLTERDNLSLRIFEELANREVMRVGSVYNAQFDGMHDPSEETVWDGSYATLDGKVCESSFRPRLQSSFDALYRQFISQMNQLVQSANTPEELLQVLSSKESMQNFAVYKRMVCDDIHLTEQQFSHRMNQLSMELKIGLQESLDAAYQEQSLRNPNVMDGVIEHFVRNQSVTEVEYPEYQVVMMYWLQSHPEYSLQAWQYDINRIYEEGFEDEDDSQMETLSVCLSNRKKLQTRWTDAIQSVQMKNRREYPSLELKDELLKEISERSL